MPGATQTAYDRVEYPDQWYPQTHPDRLATIALLHGLDPAPPARCRVFEMGCGAGWNLIHMAAMLPESTFVGVDIAAAPIERARAYADELGLDNVTFEAVSLADVDDSWGPFDYTVAHGVYSWVPEPVRERLMAVSKALLAPQGVAYISYATYPGRYHTRMMREMMLYYARHFDDPTEKARRARALLGFLRDAQPGESSYRRLLVEEIERISKFPDQFFYHDDLSDVNEPSYFYEFAAHAGAHGLQYVSEANFHETKEHGLPEKIMQAWQAISQDVIDYEQYRDFMAFRRFRQTLLCHDDVTVQRRLSLERMRRCYAGAPARLVVPEHPDDELSLDDVVDPDESLSADDLPAPSDPAGGDGRASTRYEGLPERYVDAHTPLVRAALDHLGERWPRLVAFDALVEAARRRVEALDPGRAVPLEQDRTEIGGLLLELYGSRFVVLTIREPPVFGDVSSHPEASPLVRWQARRCPTASSLIGINVRLNALERTLLAHLDGTRDRAALRSALEADREALGIESEADLDARLDDTLRVLAQEALLVA